MTVQTVVREQTGWGGVYDPGNRQQQMPAEHTQPCPSVASFLPQHLVAILPRALPPPQDVQAPRLPPHECSPGAPHTVVLGVSPEPAEALSDSVCECHRLKQS